MSDLSPIEDLARRATAKYFDVGIDPSFIGQLQSPEMAEVPIIRMMNCIIQAAADQSFFPLTDDRDQDQ